MRRHKKMLISLVILLMLGGVALWRVAGDGGKLAGTATTPCNNDTELCAPAMIPDASGAAHWTNTSAIKFENRSGSYGNQINWRSSHGAYTGSWFFFHLDSGKNKTLSFPCQMDHIWADNKGPAANVYTSVAPAPERPVYKAFKANWFLNKDDVNTSAANQYLDLLYMNARVLKVTNKSDKVTAFLNWRWQMSDLPNYRASDPMYGQDWWYDSNEVAFSDKNQIDLGPGKTMQIVLPCSANIWIANSAVDRKALEGQRCNEFGDNNGTGLCHDLPNLWVTRVA